MKEKYKNPHEETFRKLMLSKGWKVTKRGFPDFFCWKGHKFGFVEVKPKCKSKLKKSQYFVMRVLSSYGIKCFKWSPECGFETIDEAKPLKPIINKMLLTI